MIVPIIVAFITSVISYIAARSNNKAELEKVKLIMSKDLEIAKEKHMQEIEKLEMEISLQSKAKETDVITDLTAQAMQTMMGSEFLQEKLQEKIQEAVKDK